MARPWTTVRTVGDADWTHVERLWNAAVADGSIPGDTSGRSQTADRLREVLTRNGVSTLVAVTDGSPVGFLVLTTSPLAGLTDNPLLSVEVMYVAKEHRGQGVGSHLLSSLTTLAQQRGATSVSCSVPSQSKDANRYFARLGFAPVVTRRVVGTAGLRRKLAGDEPRALDRVLAKRRSLRARADGMAGMAPHAPGH